MGKRKKVRLSDIAKRLDLSTVSISKALRDHPDIAEKTKKLIKETAEEMGYMPNLVARSLSSNSSKMLGVVVPKIAHSFFSVVLDGIHECASEHGYEIMLTVSRENAELERQHLETLLAMQVDGILVSTSQEAADAVAYERVRAMNVPLVFFDRPVEEAGFSTVTVDDEGGARDAIDYVIRQGYRRIGHLAGYDHVSIGRNRRAGYEEALRQHDLVPEPSWVIEGGFSEEYGYRGVEQWLADGFLPDAIFTVTFPVGLGAVEALREEDRALPGRIPIIAFGNERLNRHLEHPFINVFQPAHLLGCQATSLLLEEINTPDEREPRHVVLPTRLITPDVARDFTYSEDGYQAAASPQ